MIEACQDGPSLVEAKEEQPCCTWEEAFSASLAGDWQSRCFVVGYQGSSDVGAVLDAAFERLKRSLLWSWLVASPMRCISNSRLRQLT